MTCIFILTNQNQALPSVRSLLGTKFKSLILYVHSLGNYPSTSIMLSIRSRLQVLNEIARDEMSENPIKEDVAKQKAIQEAKREKRRRKIINEIFETEKTYLNHLDLIQNPRLYSMYANNHSQALTTLQEWLQKSSEFADFIQKQESLSDVNGLKLNALLITPVQRVPRYKLLLDDLLSQTLTNHHDYYSLQDATKQVSHIACHINEHIRQHENFQKMLSIQKSLGTAPKILSPGREFIKEGTLKKVARKGGGKSHDRMFFLFSDMLLYGKPKLLDTANSYTCSCVLPLRHCSVQRLFINNKKLEGGGMFQITCKEEILVLYSLDPDDVSSWVDALESAIRKLSENRSTLRKPSSNKVPLRGRTLRQKKSEKKNGRRNLQQTLQLFHDENAVSVSPEDSPLREEKAGQVPSQTSPAILQEQHVNLDISFKRKWEEEAQQLSVGEVSSQIALV
ncbi:unnamed protein product [Acanthosepion pharaonis]|uniref:Rho guanine nucleotide exchange factor 39 n=1 Tax=Acanthosepion pharaonis TaxID=158019 RepID=A0A812D534_ACAPH|nr:unnamed protein product [Sepia pharaonis]